VPDGGRSNEIFFRASVVSTSRLFFPGMMPCNFSLRARALDPPAECGESNGMNQADRVWSYRKGLRQAVLRHLTFPITAFFIANLWLPPTNLCGNYWRDIPLLEKGLLHVGIQRAAPAA